jgi:hypothetical protein
VFVFVVSCFLVVIKFKSLIIRCERVQFSKSQRSLINDLYFCCPGSFSRINAAMEKINTAVSSAAQSLEQCMVHTTA